MKLDTGQLNMLAMALEALIDSMPEPLEPFENNMRCTEEVIAKTTERKEGDES